MQEKAETAGTDAVQKFKTLQSFIDSCANYYGTGFDDCLKQVASAFPELDLSSISIDAPEPMMLARDVATEDDNIVLESQPSPLADDGVVLAQPATTPPAFVPKPSDPTVNVDGASSQKGGDTLADALDV